MPDFERLTRQLAIDLECNQTEKDKLKAYFKGLDRGRIECCIIVSSIIIMYNLKYFL